MMASLRKTSEQPLLRRDQCQAADSYSPIAEGMEKRFDNYTINSKGVSEAVQRVWVQVL